MGAASRSGCFLAVCASFLISTVPAQARPPVGDDGDLPPGVDRVLECIENTRASIGASPSTIALGGSTRLSWSVRVPPNCPLLQRLGLNGTPVTFSGSMPVQPMSNTTYRLQMQIPGGSATMGSTEVTVSLPSVVRITGGTAEWRNLLVQAVGSVPAPPAPPSRLVLIADGVDMDMTGLSHIAIHGGVTLTSEAKSPGNAPPVLSRGPLLRTIAYRPPIDVLRPHPLIGPVARNAQNPGPRLFTRSRPKPLFFIPCAIATDTGDKVSISGFRLEGPHPDPEEGDDNLERGISVDSCNPVEITNMEVSGWSGQAIYVQKPFGQVLDPEAIRIHDNFLHNNQHVGGNGYGVDVSAGAHALIERNVFDLNRHAIAASGKPGTSYVARRNLVLRGGGFHDSYPVYGSYYTHQFDVHGTDHCYHTPIKDIYQFGCGDAGEFFEMRENAFQYTRGNAVKVRGNPSVGAVVARNVFAHGSRGDAIQQNGNSGPGDNITMPIEVTGNKFGIQTYGKYGVCDFDGDGRDDLFLATGVSWWYASAGRMHWTFLNAQDALLETLGLGDFDGDRRCDVFAVHANDFMISSGGTGEWRSLGTFAVPFSQLAFADFNGDGIQDVLRRAPDGQWWAISPGIYDWTALQSSSFPLSQLRFGHFDDDRIADVVAVQGGRWSVSFGGRTAWQRLNPTLSDKLQPLLIGDVDGDRIDDIVRYEASADGLTGNWSVSRGGAGPWEPLASLGWQDTYQARQIKPARFVVSFTGRFDLWNGGDVLALDYDRRGHIHSNRAPGFFPHSLHAF